MGLKYEMITILVQTRNRIEIVLFVQLFCAEYTAMGSNEELPLGEEFQSLLKCFIVHNEKKAIKRFAPAKKLLQQLE